jgi:hypothetical protein
MARPGRASFSDPRLRITNEERGAPTLVVWARQQPGRMLRDEDPVRLLLAHGDTTRCRRLMICNGEGGRARQRRELADALERVDAPSSSACRSVSEKASSTANFAATSKLSLQEICCS